VAQRGAWWYGVLRGGGRMNITVEGGRTQQSDIHVEEISTVAQVHALRSGTTLK
jgi:hypothetical protein